MSDTLPYAHVHRYQVAQIKKEFEPTDIPEIYQLVEYSYLLCPQCASVVKVPIDSAPDMLK